LDLDGTAYPSIGEEAVLTNTLFADVSEFQVPTLAAARAAGPPVNTWPSGQPHGKVSDDIVAIAGQAVEGLGRS
jgi:hypothetical protein